MKQYDKIFIEVTKFEPEKQYHLLDEYFYVEEQSNVIVLSKEEYDSLQKKITDLEMCERMLVDQLNETKQEEEYEPYCGWCDVEGCENEGANGGGCWSETGYWIVCSNHSQQHREGKDQPKMKQSAIDRENSRLPNGRLP